MKKYLSRSGRYKSIWCCWRPAWGIPVWRSLGPSSCCSFAWSFLSPWISRTEKRWRATVSASMWRCRPAARWRMPTRSFVSSRNALPGFRRNKIWSAVSGKRTPSWHLFSKKITARSGSAASLTLNPMCKLASVPSTAPKYHFLKPEAVEAEGEAAPGIWWVAWGASCVFWVSVRTANALWSKALILTLCSGWRRIFAITSTNRSSSAIPVSPTVARSRRFVSVSTRSCWPPTISLART